MKLTEIYEKYISLDYRKRILIFVVLVLLVRLVFIHKIDMEIDTYYYACLTQDIKTAIVTGKIFTTPINHEHYRGIEYRSPLFSFLAAIISLIIGNIEASLIAVSLIAGCILVIPVFLLARRLWGDPAGELAALIVTFSPHLVLYSITGRSESLYTVLFTFAVYFVILAYEQNKWKDFILAGVFWGLAYQTRFEALAAAFTTLFLFFFGLIDKRFKKNNAEYLRKTGAFLLVFFLVILPYTVIIFKTSGELSLASPSKKLYDLKESLWIISEQPGGYSSFMYNYGISGEKSYSELKSLIKQTPDEMLSKNTGIVLSAIIRSIPINLRMILVNFNILILLFLITPVLAKWKLKDPRIAILWLYLLTAIPIVLLSYWDSDPRYYSFFIPLLAINTGGIIKSLYEGKKPSPVENEKLKSIFTWVLIPGALLLSWYFYNGNAMAPGWLELNFKDTVIALHKSLIILMIIFAGTGILALLLSIIWKRIFLFFTIPAGGLGILVVLAGFLEAKKTEPVQISVFFTQQFYAPVRSVILWLFVAGLLYEALLFVCKRFQKVCDLNKALITVCLIFLVLINIHNIITVNKNLEVFRYLNYHPEAVSAIKSKGLNPISAMCLHPQDAFALGAKWLKVPPETDFVKFQQLVEKDKPDCVITDSKTVAGTSFRPVYPIFMIMRENSALTELKYYEKNNFRLNENLIKVWVYQRKKDEEKKSEVREGKPETGGKGNFTTEALRRRGKGWKFEGGNETIEKIQQRSFDFAQDDRQVALQQARGVFSGNLSTAGRGFSTLSNQRTEAGDGKGEKRIFTTEALRTLRRERKGKAEEGIFDLISDFQLPTSIFGFPLCDLCGSVVKFPGFYPGFTGLPGGIDFSINDCERGFLTDSASLFSPIASKSVALAPQPWGKFHNDLRNTGRSPYEGPGMGAEVAWKFKAGHEIFSSPVVSKKGQVIFGCDDSNVYAVNFKGGLAWKYKTDYYASASPGLSPDGTVYIGSDDQHLYSISPKGKLNWRFKTKYFVSSGAVVTKSGRIIVCGEDNFVYCLNNKGNLIWKYKTGGEIIGTPAISGSTLYVTCQDGNLYYISMKGNLVRKFKAGGELISSPAVSDDGIIYFGSDNHNLYAVTGKGKLKWKYKTGGAVLSSPAIAPDGTILFGSKDGYLYALSPKGKLRWKFETGFSVESSPAVDAIGRVYFGSHDRCIYGLSPEGKLLWKVETGGAVYSSPAIGPDGTIYAGSMDKYLYAVRKSSPRRH